MIFHPTLYAVLATLFKVLAIPIWLPIVVIYFKRKYLP